MKMFDPKRFLAHDCGPIVLDGSRILQKRRARLQ